MATTYDISPTLVQCFGIILIGYLTGKFKMITPNQGKGLSTFIGTFSLPAMIFKAMIEVQFPLVNWTFWTALLVAKAVVFFLVMIPSLFLEKDKPFAAAGLYSIFVSQSNDMAFGLPLCKYFSCNGFEVNKITNHESNYMYSEIFLQCKFKKSSYH